MTTPQWNPQLCEETLLLFERLRKKKEDEFDALICEASRLQHKTFSDYFEKLERMLA